MEKNLSTTDRLARLGLALVLFLVAWWQSSWLAAAVASSAFMKPLLAGEFCITCLESIAALIGTNNKPQ